MSATQMPVSTNDETVVPLPDFPQSCTGAPCPAVFSTNDTLLVSFYLADSASDWYESQGAVVGPGGVMTAVVTFERPSVHLFGPPNDEAFGGHRLAKKGLRPYGAYEVLNSEWIKHLEVMNSVHHRHDKQRFLARDRHFILTFHDETFECIAYGLSIEAGAGSPVRRILDKMPALDC